MTSFEDSSWLEIVKWMHERDRNFLDEWKIKKAKYLKGEDADFGQAFIFKIEVLFEVSGWILDGKLDHDDQLKCACHLGALQTEAQVYRSNPRAALEFAEEYGGFEDMLSDAFFVAESERFRSNAAIVGRVEQVERTKKANKDFYKKLCDIAEEFLAEGVTHSRTSKKTKDYFDETGLWDQFGSMPLGLKTVRKILREYQIIPQLGKSPKSLP